MTPMFSFLTTAYRTEPYIAATIESVLAQTRWDWEMIVVDNGCSDEIASVVNTYAEVDDRIRLIRQPNRGYRGGVSAAAEHARGTFVCVLDSDDQVMPEFCERVAALLESDPAIDVVGVDAHRFVETEDVDLPVPFMRSVGVTAVADPKQPLTITDVIGGRVPYYTAAIRRTAWHEAGGYEPGIDDVEEDVILWCRLVGRFDVRLLPDQLARYRLRPDSLTREPANVEAFEQRLMRSYVEGAKLSRDPANRAALDTTLRRLRYYRAIRRARYALVAGDTEGARSAARAAFGERRTVRAALVLGSVTVAPGLMRRIHPIKGRVSDTVTGLVARDCPSSAVETPDRSTAPPLSHPFKLVAHRGRR